MPPDRRATDLAELPTLREGSVPAGPHLKCEATTFARRSPACFHRAWCAPTSAFSRLRAAVVRRYRCLVTGLKVKALVAVIAGDTGPRSSTDAVTTCRAPPVTRPPRSPRSRRRWRTRPLPGRLVVRARAPTSSAVPNRTSSGWPTTVRQPAHGNHDGVRPAARRDARPRDREALECDTWNDTPACPT